MQPATIAETIAKALQGSDQDIDLAAVALEIARITYPSLDSAIYLRRLDEMAAMVECRRRDPLTLIESLNECLFERLGFRGNIEEYHDPRNSFLNEVLDRRTGLPITLSLVYMEVARRIDLPICGVGFPGHFLVKYPGEPEIVLDCFNGGKILLEPDCEERLQEVYGRPMAMNPLFLGAVTKKQMVTRMLHNLKVPYCDQILPQAALIDEILFAIQDLPPGNRRPN
jgi:regulator of sirC expression with transglutaminase-like and TPR domain